MSRTCLRSVLLVLGLSASAAGVNAADIAVDPASKGTLALKGEIGPGDSERLMAAVTAGKKTGHPIDTFRLNSVGGQVEAGIQLAKTVRALKLDTVVGDGDQCASMCVLVYAAGIDRRFHPGGLLAVHSVSTFRLDDQVNGYEDDSAKATTLDLARLYMQFGTPDGIVGKMIAASGKRLAYLTTDDIEADGFASPLDAPPLQRQMSCSLDGVANWVTWHPDQTLQVGEQRYAIAESHQAKTGAWVATADSPRGNLQAVFGGPDPRLVIGSERTGCTTDAARSVATGD